MKQKDLIIQLFQELGGHRPQIITAYAAAERGGLVQRHSNVNNLSAEQYASALFSNGVRRAWFHG